PGPAGSPPQVPRRACRAQPAPGYVVAVAVNAASGLLLRLAMHPAGLRHTPRDLWVRPLCSHSRRGSGAVPACGRRLRARSCRMADRARGTGFAMGSHDEMPLLSTLKRAAAALREADIPVALWGGYAAYARGAGAPHHDVDFLILEADTERGLDALASIGMRTAKPPASLLGAARGA